MKQVTRTHSEENQDDLHITSYYDYDKGLRLEKVRKSLPGIQGVIHGFVQGGAAGETMTIASTFVSGKFTSRLIIKFNGDGWKPYFDDTGTNVKSYEVTQISTGYKDFSSSISVVANSGIRNFKDGTFSILNWSNYPSGLAKPSGLFRFLPMKIIILQGKPLLMQMTY